ncbi:HAMP domain-containing protein [Streptacidiphilus jiangxiensis]|uniref:HAMP domain-containing protein n=1 Tax=Streptacidiphilus jiangxiensis TaxID=235985 RepID=A0A1H7MF88_STRJI|nr:HAMP domain-containing protein [Streptacidiphilus jiangxiensis]SEL09832.1 HAMP domain-containing protein [Streptacidiphilus jiangxiensis]
MPLLGGVRPPVAALLCTLLAVAAITALALGRNVTIDVAPAVLTSQQHLAEDAASALRATVDRDLDTLRHQAAELTALSTPGSAQPADAALPAALAQGHPWSGVVVADRTDGRVLAVGGEPVPAAAVQAAQRTSAATNADGTRNSPRPTLITLPDGQARLSFWATVDNRLLVTTDTLRLTAPGGDTSRGVLIVDGRGRTVAALGPALVGTQDQRIPASSARASTGLGGGVGQTRNSGFLLGDLRDGRRTVAGWADLVPATDTAVHPLGLVVVVVVNTPQAPDVSGNSLLALSSAAGLLLATLVVTLLLVTRLQRPLLQLHLGGVRIARGDLSRPAPLPRSGEAARIGHALDGLRRQLLGEPAELFRPLRRRFGAGALVVSCGVVLAAWSAPLLLISTRPVSASAVPHQLVADQQTRTSAAAARVRETLAEGVQDVTTMASALDGASTPERAQGVLSAWLDQHGRYGSVYVLARDGQVLTTAGGTPRQALHRLTGSGGLVQVNTAGRIPVLAAWAPVPAARPAVPGQQPIDLGDFTPVAVVAEFDISALDTALDQPGMGSVWLVDARQKVIASRNGFRAYESLPSPALTGLAQDAATGPQSRLLPQGSDQLLAAAAPLGAVTGTDTSESWQIVSSQNASWLDLGAYRTQRLTLLAGLLGLTAVAGCLGWLHVLVVRPLRDLAETAERLAGGDRRTVRYPVHHDEVGSVTRSLELIRQQLGTAPARRTGRPGDRSTART